MIAARREAEARGRYRLGSLIAAGLIAAVGACAPRAPTDSGVTRAAARRIIALGWSEGGGRALTLDRQGVVRSAAPGEPWRLAAWRFASARRGAIAGGLVAAASQKGAGLDEVTVRRLEGGAVIYRAPVVELLRRGGAPEPALLRALALSDEGARLALATESGRGWTVSVMALLPAPALLSEITVDHRVDRLTFSPSGALIEADDGEALTLLEARGGRVRGRWRADEGELAAGVAFDADGARLELALLGSELLTLDTTDAHLLTRQELGATFIAPSPSGLIYAQELSPVARRRSGRPGGEPQIVARCEVGDELDLLSLSPGGEALAGACRQSAFVTELR